jgi:hypothetical protein
MSYSKGIHGGRGNHGKNLRNRQELKDIRDSFFAPGKPVSLKYPQDIGEDAEIHINYNTHDSTEYARNRVMHGIDSSTNVVEPFIFFEFLELISKDALKRYRKINPKYKLWEEQTAQVRLKELVNDLDPQDFADAVNEGPSGAPGTDVWTSTVMNERKELILAAAEDTSVFDRAKRVYGGSVALYMPTDIQINDQIVYNEDSRKTMANIQATLTPAKADTWNPTVMSSTGAMTTVAAATTAFAKKVGTDKNWAKRMPKWAGEWLGKADTGIGAILGAGAAQVVGSETQRHTGNLINPNEYMAYQNTGMRSFTFSWTFLPDSLEESEQTTLIIKQFRKAAHATKLDLVNISVPDHLVVSFHGAADMIQLPPVVIESVNVSYNPNNTSFFKQNNAPVEVGLSITLKEIVPIYKQDVVGGM